MSKRPVLLFACSGVDTSAWLTALRTELTDVDIRVWPDSGPVDEVDFAFVWKYPPGLLASFPKLRAIFSLGAGVESILADSALPQNVPLVRMVDPGLAIGMNEFVLMRVLHYHREMPAHESSQQQQRWHRTVAPLPEDRRVGLLGLGELGGACARTLVGLGFDVAGWTRNPRALPGMQTFAGRDQLAAFLARTQILVCLLPLTPDTANIIDRRTLDALPRGAYLINVARGQHVVDADLIAALDADQIAHATLDVFREEPLPAEHPFWRHPRITVVPHISAITQVKTAARTLAANVRRVVAGQAPLNIVDRQRGY